jgi:hypothetical protein
MQGESGHPNSNTLRKLMICCIQFIVTVLQAISSKATSNTRTLVSQFLYSQGKYSIRIPFTVMRTFQACTALHRANPISCLLGSPRKFTPTSNMSLTIRPNRSADGPFKLIETPAHAQKATVSRPRFLKFLIMTEIPETL